MSRINCSTVVLDALSVLDPEPLPVRLLVRLAALFGLTQNAARVAIFRLVEAGKLEATSRRAAAAYRLTARTRALNRYVRAAALVRPRTVRWRGEWLQVLLSLREDRRGGRGRLTTALEVFHLASPHRGVWMRPCNLVEGPEELSARFRELGVLSRLDVLTCRFTDPRRERELAGRLWPLRRLGGAYERAADRLEESEQRLRSLPAEEALRETWRLGGEAIRLLFRDPLLPPELLPPGWPGPRLRRTYARYSRAGFRLWRSYFRDALNAPAAERVFESR